MRVMTLSLQELDQNINRAKQASLNGPVFITDCGKPVYVLLSIDEYRRISGKPRNIVDALSMPGASEIEFDPAHSRELPRFADFD